jgi:predicted permease
LTIRYRVVGLRYFETMGTQILRGRGFERMDGPDSSKVTVINQTLARRYWPEENALGRSIEIGGEPHQIVGISEDGKYDSLREAPQPFLYLPHAQNDRGGEAYLLVETAVSPTSLIPAIRSELQATEPNLVVAQALSLQEQMQMARYADQMGAGLVGIMASLAVFLSAVGLFGVVSYNISRRRREIGLRMAMGATRTRVMRMVLGYGFRLALFGLPFGLAAALALSHVLASLLYGIRPTDPASFLGASCLILLVIAAACSIPARRAARIAPMEALRHE